MSRQANAKAKQAAVVRRTGKVVQTGKVARRKVAQSGKVVGRPTRSPVPAKVSSGVELFGTKTGLAEYLGVSKTQPGRWIEGAEVPTASTARLVTDLDYVWDRIRTDMGEQAAGVWLRSANRFLGGATPLDWLKVHGPSQVIAAFDGAEAGSYA